MFNSSSNIFSKYDLFHSIKLAFTKPLSPEVTSQGDLSFQA